MIDYAQFTDDDLDDYTAESYFVSQGIQYCFSGGMVSTCAPLFPDHWSNYDVERDLKKNGVLMDEFDKTDTEYSSLYVYFKTKGDALAFLRRLNFYLTSRANTLAELGFLENKKTEV